jgi:methionine aminopeptidase
VANDWVKIDLGVHIDGFITVAAHTLIVPNPTETVDASAAAPSTALSEPTAAVASVPGAAAISAAWVAAELAVKLVKNGGTNSAVTAAVVCTHRFFVPA